MRSINKRIDLLEQAIRKQHVNRVTLIYSDGTEKTLEAVNALYEVLECNGNIVDIRYLDDAESQIMSAMIECNKTLHASVDML
ncbi:hypothetical protein [Massiliimalia massiliensis]|uniref:hypothetical protein n=1 Tax=Massiliimalia massiliensis TaxID=1852384 RepID=UPI0009875A8D|nr:hypothetical protein [Massiliimalia massiliensis]